MQHQYMIRLVSKSHLRLSLAGSADWCKTSVSKVRLALVDPSIVTSSTGSSVHPMPLSGRVRFCPRPRACEGWTALLDPYGSLELVALPKSPGPGRAVLHGTLNNIGKIHCLPLILENWVLSHCPLQQLTTLCGMHELCGMLTTTKRSTLRANAV